MKKLFSVIFLLVYTNTFCQSPSCTPQPCIRFQNTDLWQIWGAIQNGSGGGTTSCCTSSTQTVSLGAADRSILSGIQNTLNAGLNIGGFTAKVTSTLNADGAYTSGDNVGGVRSFIATRVTKTSCMLSDIQIWDAANQMSSFTIDFYKASPSGTFTDNAPQVISDFGNYLGTVSVSSGDYVTTGSVARATITGISLSFVVGSIGDPIYFTVLTNSSPSYGSPTNLVFKFGLLQD